MSKAIEQILSSEGVVLQVNAQEHPLAGSGEFKLVVRHMDDMLNAINDFLDNRRMWEYLSSTKKKEILHTLWWIYTNDEDNTQSIHSFESCCFIVGVNPKTFQAGIIKKLKLSKEELIQLMFQEGDPKKWLYEV